ncbi:hypothetical protein DFH07DRAFT_940511 [Mycena maculata]|uniref:F-box domain-containing protein n=1 Tax=Mycena maculata TaxID=230809 RepID=A0AAD7J934_9AGAR|nr:hypothetical protein DFH07DRAFT_940511 [Mycena maculata]
MHIALAIPEIVQGIFAQVDTLPGTGRGDLASAARCCRHLSEPALDRLWSRMWDLRSLLNLLDGLVEEDGICILRGKVHRKEWTRFTSYAARIRVLYYTNNPQTPPSIDASVFIQIGRLSQGKLLFPRLIALYFTASRFPVPELLLFKAESLLDLEFTCWNSTNMDYALANYLTSLPDSCRLRSVLFSGRTSKLSVASLARFPLLKLTVTDVPWDVDSKMLGVISGLDCLTELVLDLKNINFDSLDVPRDACTALESLNIDGSLHTMSSFLKKFPGPSSRLRSLSLFQSTIIVPSSEELPVLVDAWRDLFFAIARYSSTLRTIMGDSSAVFWSASDLPISGMRILEPLLACKCIDNFFMFHFPPLWFTNHDIDIIASAWPALIVAHFPISPPAGAPSPTALYAFAKHCPHLDDLQISVDTRDTRVKLATVRGAPVRHSLRRLRIETPLVESTAADVLALFVAMFPQLDTIGSDSNPEVWEGVNGLLTEYRARTAE